MINEVGTVAKSNRKIVAIETKTDTRSLFWLGRGFSIKVAGLNYLSEIMLSYKQEYALDETMTVDNSVIYSYMYLTSTMTCYQPYVDTPCTELHSNLNADDGSTKIKHLCYFYFPVDIASLFSM